MTVEAVDGGQREVGVEGVGLEALHDGEDGHTVPPDIAGDVKDLAPTNPTSVQVDRGR